MKEMRKEEQCVIRRLATSDVCRWCWLDIWTLIISIKGFTDPSDWNWATKHSLLSFVCPNWSCQGFCALDSMPHFQIVIHAGSNLFHSCGSLFPQITRSDFWCVSMHLTKVRKYIPSIAYLDNLLLALKTHKRYFQFNISIPITLMNCVIQLHKNYKKYNQRGHYSALCRQLSQPSENVVVDKLSKPLIKLFLLMRAFW